MRYYRHTKYKINPPSDIPEGFEHDCQANYSSLLREPTTSIYDMKMAI